MNSLYNFKAFFIAFWIINRTSATKSMKTKKKALKLSKIISSFEVPGSWIRFFFGQKRDPIPAFQAMRVYYNAMLTTGEGAFSKVYLAESIQDKGGLAAVKVRIRPFILIALIRIQTRDSFRWVKRDSFRILCFSAKILLKFVVIEILS